MVKSLFLRIALAILDSDIWDAFAVRIRSRLRAGGRKAIKKRNR